MKKYISILLLVLIAACSEEPRGQYPVDGASPKPVINPVVQNGVGSAKITYRLPDETDLLYVKAVYKLGTGQDMEVKTSAFTNSLVVEGFGRSSKNTVNLITVDRSRNESEPVPVEVEPDDSPIYDIRESITTVAGFGGIKLTWDNPSKFYTVVGVMKMEDNKYRHLETYYSTELSAQKAIRGMDSISTVFGIYVRDAYNNYTDTLVQTLKPLYEEQLDKKHFAGLPLSSKFVISQYGTSNMNAMWDGVVSDVTSKGIYYISAGSGHAPYINFDMGQKAKLSRFRLWSRADYYFRLHSPKNIVVYGTNDYSVASNPDSPDSQWTELLVGESYRPSGLSPDVLPTDEDLAYAKNGEEFEFPLEAPAVRYIRFKQLKSWTGTDGFTISEFTFWGSPVKN